MVGIVKIGEYDIEMRADGATPFLYKQTFNKDIIKLFNDANNSQDATEIAGGLASELGFVMAQQAKQPDPLKVSLSQGELLKWASQFAPLDLTMAAIDIINFYVGTQDMDSVAKKKAEPLTEN